MVGINTGPERPQSASTPGEEHSRERIRARRLYQNSNYVPSMEELEERNSVRSTSTQASTVATTASLASRLAALNVDYDTKPGYEPSLGIPLEGSEESGFSSDSDTASAGDGAQPGRGGSVGAIEPIIPRLPPFMVCSRLFIFKGNHPVQLKRISIQQCEELKLHGYTIIDNFINKDVAAAVKATAFAQFKRGRMVEGGRAAVAAGLPPDTLFVDRVMRGDHVMWLSMGKPPADSSPVAQMLVALQELYEDLAQFVRLKRSTGEYQLSVQPGGAFGMSRHRDALPDNGRGARGGAGSSHLQPPGCSSSSAAAAAAVAALAAAAAAGASGSAAAGTGAPVGAAGSLTPFQAMMGGLGQMNGSGHGSSNGHSCNLSAASSSVAGAGAGAHAGPSSSNGGAATVANGSNGAVNGGAGPSSLSSAAGSGTLVHAGSSSNPASPSLIAHHPSQPGPSPGPSGSSGPHPPATYGPGVAGRASSTDIPGTSSQLHSMSSHPQQQVVPGHRRVTCMVCCNPEWEKEHGGVVRVWPPRRSLGPSHGAGGRRSLTGSEAGTSQLSEDRSDTYSLRSHYFGGTGGASVTSSMWAELGAQDHETASVDNFSVADPADQKEQREGVEWVEIDGEMALDIAPLAGRVVVFLSGAVDHGVSPCTADLASATAWYQ